MRYRLVALVLAPAACIELSVESPPPASQEPPPACRPMAITIAAGEAHSCAIRDDQTTWCWGRNNVGQLGAGQRDLRDRTTPVEVAASTRFKALAAGLAHTCALADDGSVWCWGSNALGQLSGESDSDTPMRVMALPRATAIAVGYAHSCALAEDGTVWCWGDNGSGQLGNTHMKELRKPEMVLMEGDQPFLEIRQIAAGGNTTCAVDGSGDSPELWCWGYRFSEGQSFSGTPPVSVPVPEPPAQIAIGADFLCALTTSGAVYCRGKDDHGQLGGSVWESGRAVFPRTEITTAITAGAYFACAANQNRALWCWGQNEDMQITDDRSNGHTRPHPTAFANVDKIAAGGGHLCVVSADKAISCRGANGHGQLGDGSVTTRAIPKTTIAALTGTSAIASGGRHSCATLVDKVMCWGGNDRGQLGVSSYIDRSEPTPVAWIEHVKMIALGDDHSCALLRDGTAMCWGANDHRQLGDLSRLPDASIPVPTMIDRIDQLSAGAAHTCAVVADEVSGRVVVCWGRNDHGQCGQAMTETAAGPSIVAGLPAIEKIVMGDEHACALGADRRVWCWGRNESGELGNGEIADSSMPVMVQSVEKVIDIAAHGSFTCAIIATESGAEGDVRCWGDARHGQMGDETTTFRLRPGAPVKGVTGATKLMTGGAHACAVVGSQLKCWGAGSFGQVGNGEYRDSHVPVVITIPPGSTVIDLAGGDRHTCALLEDATSKTVTCWGDGRAGQLGDGTSASRASVEPRLPCP